MPIGLGIARGAIEISTGQLKGVAAVARSVGQQVTRSLGTIDAATKKTESNFSRLSKGIGQLRGELAALSVGAGLVVGMGLRTAGAFEEAAIKLSGMTGGLAEAEKLSANLRKQAKAAGLPFQDMLSMATRLLPTFEGNTKELEKWFDIVKRTSVLNTQEGVSGAAFSINEALSSGGTDLVSLVERFNISRVKLREELAENGNDFRLALDKVLTDMGITTEVAERMGQSFNASFRVLKDAGLQLLAEGFLPLMQTLTPILQQSADWLATLRQTNPEVATLGAGLATATAAGVPLLLMFNQLVEAGRTLKSLGVLGMLGRGGVLGGAVVGGAFGGLSATRAIGRATGNESAANATFGSILETFHKTLFAALTQIIRALQAFVDTVMRAAASLGSGFDMMLSAIARFVRGIASMIPGRLGGDTLSRGAASMDRLASRGIGSGAVGLADNFREQSNAMLLQLAQRIDPSAFATASPGAGAGQRAFVGRGGGSDFSGEQTAAIAQWAASVQRIERDAARQRLETTRQFEKQRSDTIANHERSIAREAEDFARRRARAAETLNRQIADIQAEAAKREQRWADDLNETVVNARNDGNKRLAELEEDHNRRRERNLRNHQNTILSAAARLDAVAVRAEQRRFAQSQQDAEIDFRRRVDKERENLKERIDQAQEAHQERLQNARDADAERIADMQESFEEQKRIEDEDRAIRLQRQAEDFQRQLDQQAQANAERLAQIDRQAADERTALDESFQLQLQQLGIHNTQWLKIQEAKEKAALDSFEKWWDKVNENFAVQGPQPRPGNSVAALTGAGTAPKPTPQFPRSFAELMTRTNGGNRQVNVSEGAIIVNAASGQSEEKVASLVRNELFNVLEEVAF